MKSIGLRQRRPDTDLDKLAAAIKYRVRDDRTDYYEKYESMKDLLQNDGHLEIVQMIMDKSPDYKNNADRLGFTPLILAAYRGKADICENFLEKNSLMASLSSFKPLLNDLWSALDWAVYKGFVDVENVLKKYNFQPLKPKLKKGVFWKSRFSFQT